MNKGIAPILVTALLLLLLAGLAAAMTPDAPWSGDGTGTITVVSDGSSAPAQFTYSHTSEADGTWEFKTTAVAAGSHALDWVYTGDHGTFNSTMTLDAYIHRGAIVTTIPLLDVDSADAFSYGGTTLVDVLPGDEYGFKMSGSRTPIYGYYPTMEGTLTVDLNPLPTADPGGPYNGPEGSVINFDGTASSDPLGEALTYAWTFGDGGTGAGATPSHSYDDNGSYSVCLIVSDSNSQSSPEVCTTAEIANAAPIGSNLSAVTVINERDATMLQGEIFDPGQLDSFSVEVDWGDGITDTFNLPAGSTIFTRTHEYLNEHPVRTEYTVNVTLTDDNGGIHAVGQPPSYYPFGPQIDVHEDELLGWELCWSSLYGSSGNPLFQILNDCSGDHLLLAGRYHTSQEFYALAAAPRADVLFDTGTGNSTHNANGNGWYFSPSYSMGFALEGDPVNRVICDWVGGSIGELNSRLRLCWHTLFAGIDGGFRAGDATWLNYDSSWHRSIFQESLRPVVITVNNEGGPYVGVEGEAVTFDGPGSVDLEGGAHTYAWTFGDGGTGSGPTPNHTYTENGSYDVCVAVTETGSGFSEEDCSTADITNLPPTVSNLSAASPIIEGDSTTLQGEVMDPGTLDAFTLEVNWGDGISDTINYPAGTSSFAVDHQYLNDDPIGAEYVVDVAVFDDDGAEDLPAYYPHGPQVDVHEDSLVGWEPCWRATTINDYSPLSDVLSECSGEYLMLAGRPVGSQIFDVLAAAPRDDVLFDIGYGNTPHNANGSGWYFSQNHSMGFALEGDPIFRALESDPVHRAQCESVAGSPNNSHRLCWITDSGAIAVGFRSGANNGLQYNWRWERFIFQEKQTSVTVNNKGGPYSGLEGSALIFDGPGSFDGENGAYNYAWSFGDGGSGSGATPSHTYVDDGSYEVCVTATDTNNGSSAEDCSTALIINQGPALSSLTATSPITPGQVTTVQGTIADPGVLDSLTLEVDWGDGISDTLSFPAGTATFSQTHTYPDELPAGEFSKDYVINFTAVDNDGAEVVEVPPAYYPSGPQVNVHEDALLGWEACWQTLYNDDSSPLSDVLQECSGDFLMLAGRPVGSEVFDVLAAAPREDVLFEARGIYSPHNANGSRWYFDQGLSMGFALQGDPIYRNACDVLASSLYPEEANGDLRLCWRTENSDITNGWRSGSHTDLSDSADWERFIFQEESLRVNVSKIGGITQGVEGTVVSFDGTAAADPNNGALSFAWTFGDGGTGSGPTPSHSYSDNGRYDVCLTVTDSGSGSSSEGCTTAVIANQAPILSNLSATSPIDEGDTTILQGNISDPGLLDSFTLFIEWGDGISNTLNIPAGTTTFSQTHQYLNDNLTSPDFTVHVTLTDKDGGETTTAPIPAYYPNGPQVDARRSELVGWEACWNTVYADDNSPFSEVLDVCSGEYLLLAGGPVGSDLFDVLAAAPRADVLFDTNQESIAHDANGSGWYFNQNHSMGFALAGDPINLDPCDTVASPIDQYAGPNGDLRLCWHTGGDAIVNGFRSGSNNYLNQSTTWERFIFQEVGPVSIIVNNTDPVVTQDFLLSPGFSMISSNVISHEVPLDTLLATVVDDLVLIKNGEGEVFWPQLNINQIGSWKVGAGYQVYMANEAALSLAGQAAAPEAMPLELPLSWSLIGYLRNGALAVDLALDSISDQFVLVKNGAGEVYWPQYGVNQIGDMQPGQGYQVYLSEPGTLIYPAN